MTSLKKKMQSDGEHERIQVDDQRVPDSGRLVYTSVSVPSLVLNNLVANRVATSANESSFVAGSKREYTVTILVYIV